LKEGKGLLVTHVFPDTPAAGAGLKVHDVIVQFDGKEVGGDALDFARMVGDVKADAVVEVVVVRKGKQETIKEVKLPEARPVLRPNVRPLRPR
jgi:serine protease Do